MDDEWPDLWGLMELEHIREQLNRAKDLLNETRERLEAPYEPLHPRLFAGIRDFLTELEDEGL
jgi:hypothetical protein